MVAPTRHLGCLRLNSHPPHHPHHPPAPASIRSRGRGRGLGEGGSPAAFSISPRQGLLFFLSCLLGSSSSLFFLQKVGRPIWEHTQLTCHRRWLAQRLALAPPMPKGAGGRAQPAPGRSEKEGEGEMC